MTQSKVTYWLKWLLIMAVTLIASYAITVFIIFGVIFDDVEDSANQACNQFSLGDNCSEALNAINQNGLKANIDKKQGIISFFFDEGFLDIAGCELQFENNKLTEKKVWVD